MCLLIKQTKATNFTDEFLTGVYRKNSDGIGVMWADNGTLRCAKGVMTNAKELIEFYRKHAQGKDCCVHFRMRTHGHIDLHNCHPYPVFGFEGKKVKEPMLLMHNGVLHTSNHKDLSKSDTWHYVRDFLRPLLKADPSLVHSTAFLKMLEAHIGTNKFALMDTTGKAVLTNEKDWIKYEHALLSNTYAWDYYGLHPDAKKPYTATPRYGSYGGYSGAGRWYDDDYKPFTKSSPAPALPAQTVPTSAVSLPTDQKKLPFEDEAILFAERVLEISPRAFEDITKYQIERLFKEFGIKEVETWIEGLEYGGMTDLEFIAGMRDPRKVKDWLNHPNTSMLFSV